MYSTSCTKQAFDSMWIASPHPTGTFLSYVPRGLTSFSESLSISSLSEPRLGLKSKTSQTRLYPENFICTENWFLPVHWSQQTVRCNPQLVSGIFYNVPYIVSVLYIVQFEELFLDVFGNATVFTQTSSFFHNTVWTKYSETCLKAANKSGYWPFFVQAVPCY